MAKTFDNVLIISGFAGIGKTYLAEHVKEIDDRLKVVDLDSAVFKDCIASDVSTHYNFETDRYEILPWEEQYVRHIIELAKDFEAYNSPNSISATGKKKILILLVSSHLGVRKLMDKAELAYTIVLPGKTERAKKIYLDRLKARAVENPSDANTRAYKAMSEHYDEFVGQVIDETHSSNVSIVVLGDDDTLADYIKSRLQGDFYTYLRMFISAMGKDVGELTDIAHIKDRSDRGAFNFAVGQYGEIIGTTPPVTRDHYVKNGEEYDIGIMDAVNRSLRMATGWQSANSAFAGLPAIMLYKKDAKALLTVIDAAYEYVLQTSNTDLDKILGEGFITVRDTLHKAVDGVSQFYTDLALAKEIRKQKAEEAKAANANKMDTLTLARSNMDTMINGAIEPAIPMQDKIDLMVKESIERQIKNNKHDSTEE